MGRLKYGVRHYISRVPNLFVRAKKIPKRTAQGVKYYTYYYLVENYREPGSKWPKQRVIAYLGTTPPTKEQLQQIIKEKSEKTGKVTPDVLFEASKRYVEGGGIQAKREYRKLFGTFIAQELHGFDKVTLDENLMPKGEKFEILGSFVHPHEKIIIVRIKLKKRLNRDEFYKLNSQLKEKGWEYLGEGTWRKKWEKQKIKKLPEISHPKEKKIPTGYKIYLNKVYVLKKDYNNIYKKGQKFKLRIVKETEKAVLIEDEYTKSKTWLPKSKIQRGKNYIVVPWQLLIRKMPVFEEILKK